MKEIDVKALTSPEIIRITNPVQDYIKATQEANNFHPAYVGSSMLNVVGNLGMEKPHPQRGHSKSQKTYLKCLKSFFHLKPNRGTTELQLVKTRPSLG